MDKKWFTLIIGLLLAIFSTMQAVANDDKLPAHLASQNVQLNRCSKAELKAFKIFHVGYAALYKSKCQAINTIFDQSSKKLRFLYEREIPAHAFREASEEYLQINLKQKYNTWRVKISQFNQAYRDINEGDFYDLIYHPKAGLQLHLNGFQLATLDDPEIGLAYFNIWFGNEPFSEQLKKKLMASENL